MTFPGTVLVDLLQAVAATRQRITEREYGNITFLNEKSRRSVWRQSY